jgi:hypothetical protein
MTSIDLTYLSDDDDAIQMVHIFEDRPELAHVVVAFDVGPVNGAYIVIETTSSQNKVLAWNKWGISGTMTAKNISSRVMDMLDNLNLSRYDKNRL